MDTSVKDVVTNIMAGVQLAPIIFDHAIHIDEFKSICAIFK